MTDIPSLNFRLPAGWTFDSQLDLAEFHADCVLVGSTTGDPAPILLGKLAEFQSMRKSVWLDTKGAHAVYVMGKRRSGKSYTLGVLLEGLTSAGWIAQGPPINQAVIVFDTMNVFLTAATPAGSVISPSSSQGQDMKRWHLPNTHPRMRFYHPAGTAGPTEVGSTEIGLRATDITLEDWYRFFELDPYADPIAHLLADARQRVEIDGYQSDAGESIAAEPNFQLADLVTCIRTCAAFTSYDDRTREATARRLEAMQRLGIFSDSAATAANILVAGEATILFLRDIDQSLRALFVSVLVRRLMERRSSAEKFERLSALKYAEASMAEGAKRASLVHEAVTFRDLAQAGTPRTWVIIDEAHNYIPVRGEPPSRRPLKKLIDEGRNLGLSVVVATQQPSGLDQSIQRNADLLLVHSMSVRDDIDAASNMLNTRVPDSVTIETRVRSDTRVFERVIRSLPRGYCLVSSDEADRIFPILVRPRISYHGALEY